MRSRAEKDASSKDDGEGKKLSHHFERQLHGEPERKTQGMVGIPPEPPLSMLWCYVRRAGKSSFATPRPNGNNIAPLGVLGSTHL